MLNLDQVRAQFPALTSSAQDGKEPIYFDGPGGTQICQGALAAINHHLLHHNANAGGVFVSSQQTSQVVVEARRAGKDLYNAASADEIVFAANSTSLIFQLSRAIAKTWQQGDEIVLTELDHYANVSPWLLVAKEKGCKIYQAPIVLPSCQLDAETLLSKVNEKTRLVACTFASNTTGSLVDVEPLIKQIRVRSQALIFIDAVHATPHLKIDVQRLDCDFLVSSAYKYYGPHLGILYGKQYLLAELEPYKVAPASEHVPNRWETGTLNFSALAGFIATVDYLASLADTKGITCTGQSRVEKLTLAYQLIAEHETSLAGYALERFTDHKQVRLFGLTELSQVAQRTATFGFLIQGYSPLQVAEYFAQQGIYLWHGNFYAQALCQRLGVLDKGGLVRLGCMHYNTKAELTRFFNLLDKLIDC